jgi:hypothetical protein
MRQVSDSIAKGQSFVYEDQIMTHRPVPAFANPTAPAVNSVLVTTDLAISSRTVRSLLVCDQKGGTHPYLGQYTSNALLEGSSDNFQINDERLYDTEIDTPAKANHQLSLGMGSAVQVPTQIYSYETDSGHAGAAAAAQNSTFAGTIEAIPFANFGADIRGTAFYTGCSLSLSPLNQLGNGRLIGSKPCKLQRRYRVSQGQNAARTQRVYAAVERVCNITGGVVTVSA